MNDNKYMNTNINKIMDTNSLEIAIDRGDLDSIKLAREQGLDINSLSSTGNPMLYNVVLRMTKKEEELPLLEVMKELLKFPEVDVNKCNTSFNFTALNLAVRDNKLGFVKLLLESGANVNTQCKLGQTPLIVACLKENIDCINLLMRYNPDVNVIDKNGDSALTCCITRKFMPGFDLLLNKSDITAVYKTGQPRIYSLCASNNSEMRQKFCEYGKEIGVLDVLRQQLEVVKEKYTNGPTNFFYEVKTHINALQMNEKLNKMYNEEKPSKQKIKI